MSQSNSYRANVKDLRRALHILNKVIPRNPVLPALDQVVFHCVSSEIISVTATDLSLHVKVSLTDDPIHLSSASFILPFAELNKFIRRINSEIIDFVVTDSGLQGYPAQKVAILADEGEFRMRPDVELGDFPKTPTFKKQGQFAMLGHQLKEGLRLVYNSVSTDDLRPAMCKVYAESIEGAIRFVSTDGATLSMYESNTSYAGPAFYIDRKVSMLLASLRFNKSNFVYGEVGTGHLLLACGDIEIVSKFNGDERFPDYLNVIPNTPPVAGAFDAKLLKFHVGIAELFANRTTHSARFTLENGLLKIYAEDLDYDSSSSQTMAIEYAGDKFEIGFNLRLMRDLLKHCDERVQFSFFAANKAALFHHSPKYGIRMTYLQMPVMLNKYEDY